MILRPKLNSPEVLALYYKLFAVEIQKQCPDLCDKMSLQEIEEGLAEAGKPDFDGYEYAKDLERHGWDGISASDVEVLDNAFSTLCDAHNKIVMQWVANNNIKPKLKDGEACSYKGEIGTIHYEERTMKIGVYLFRSETWKAEKGNQGGRHVNWEDAEALPF